MAQVTARGALDTSQPLLVVAGGSDGIGSALVEIGSEFGVEVHSFDLRVHGHQTATFHRVDLTQRDQVQTAMEALPRRPTYAAFAGSARSGSAVGLA
jgi:NAD(P)-dependent dehydrogenase (short-subunit alcohol dehydrogenase family)